MPPEPDLSASSLVSRPPEILATAIQGSTIMLDLKQGQYYGLDDIGADIWARLAEPITVGDLCDQLTAAYAVEAGTCRRDVLRLLEKLRRRELLRVHGSEAEQG
jgi:CRP-like cAMP-binding protein